MKNKIYLLILLAILVILTQSFISKGKKDCKEKILGKWINMSDSKEILCINKKKWVNSYENRATDSSSYFFLNNSCDTICVIYNSDTMVYHIESLDHNYLDLDFLGEYNDRESWTNKILSYKRIALQIRG